MARIVAIEIDVKAVKNLTNYVKFKVIVNCNFILIFKKPSGLQHVVMQLLYNIWNFYLKFVFWEMKIYKFNGSCIIFRKRTSHALKTNTFQRSKDF